MTDMASSTGTVMPSSSMSRGWSLAETTMGASCFTLRPSASSSPKHPGCHDRACGTVAAPRVANGSERVTRFDRLDRGVVLGRWHDPNVTADHAAPVCRRTTTICSCPRGKRFTARPLRCERPW